MLSGNRVSLLPLEREHLALLQSWRNQEDVRQNCFFALPCTSAGQDEWYSGVRKEGRAVFFVLECASDPEILDPIGEDRALVGYCGLSDLDWRKRRGVASLIIGDARYRGRGIGEEALRLLLNYSFVEMGLHKLAIYAFSDNVRSVSLFSKFARIEGELVEHEFSEGAWRNVTLLGITEREYLLSIGASSE